MGNAAERISGQLNVKNASAADAVWNDAGDEPDISAQDTEDIREVTADAADSGKRADVFFAEVLENTRSHVRILPTPGNGLTFFLRIYWRVPVPMSRFY